ncbi:hypothetical protein B0H11DRAFT_1946201 [Mycena galericulata]|nr:hypothetical protein B0H11DRAFT_1946201 [Mycena galericulata]
MNAGENTKGTRLPGRKVLELWVVGVGAKRGRGNAEVGPILEISQAVLLSGSDVLVQGYSGQKSIQFKQGTYPEFFSTEIVSSNQVGIQVIAELWKGLEPAGREKWEAEAVEKSRRDQASDGSIYENQQKLPRTLFGLLQGTLHAGKGGIGVGAYHILYSYRNSQEEMVVGSLTINSADSENVPFQTACVDYGATTQAPWEPYSHQTIGFNKNIDHNTKLEKNAGGFYVLPPFDEETGTLKDFRETLRLFMEASFFQVVPRTGAMPAMPWSEFLSYPEEFLHPRLIVDGILARPDAMAAADVRAFANCIHKFQVANDKISIFNDKNIISAAILDHQSRAAAAKPEEIVELVDADDKSHLDSPLTSPARSPRILPVDNTVPETPLISVQPAPPSTIPRKRRATGPPPSDAESQQLGPLRRSSRHNTVPAPHPNGRAVATKRRKTRH